MGDQKPKPKQLPPYRDVGKPLNDLLTKGFPTTYKFELTTAADNGVKFITSAERKQRDVSDDSGNTVKANYIFASFQPKLEVKDKGLTASATIDSEKLSGELSLADLFTPGVKATFKGLSNSKQEVSGDFEFRNEAFSGTLGVFYKDDVPRLETTALVGQNGIAAGGLLSYFLPSGKDDGSPDSVTFLANYNTSKFDVISTLTGKWAKESSGGQKVMKVSFGTKLLYTHDDAYTFGGDVAYDTTKSFKDGTSFTLLGQRKFDSNTTGKFKVDTKGTLALAYAQKVNPSTQITIGTEINLLKDVEPKVGLTFAFAP
jgi:hypothetical protein